MKERKQEREAKRESGATNGKSHSEKPFGIKIGSLRAEKFAKNHLCNFETGSSQHLKKDKTTLEP